MATHHLYKSTCDIDKNQSKMVGNSTEDFDYWNILNIVIAIENCAAAVP